MGRSNGYRNGTRSLFARSFRKHGMPGASVYLSTYKIGDRVDIKVNGAIHKGMPYKYYHGKTGVVFDVTKHGVGVKLLKTVGNKRVEKRLHVRPEHIKLSRCDSDFKVRAKENDEKRRQAMANGIDPRTLCLKRLPAGPRPAMRVSLVDNSPEVLVPVFRKPVY